MQDVVDEGECSLCGSWVGQGSVLVCVGGGGGCCIMCFVKAFLEAPRMNRPAGLPGLQRCCHYCRLQAEVAGALSGLALCAVLFPLNLEEGGGTCKKINVTTSSMFTS